MLGVSRRGAGVFFIVYFVYFFNLRGSLDSPDGRGLACSRVVSLYHIWYEVVYGGFRAKLPYIYSPGFFS